MLHNFRRTRTPDIGGSRCWCEGGERLSELVRRLFVFADLDAVGERLVRQSLALIVGARVQGRAVYEQGRLTVHGLLTATVPTIIGGSLNLIARTMDLEFIAPVYTDDHIICAVTAAEVEPRPYGAKVRITATATNQQGTTVLTGAIFGIIRETTP